MKTAKVIILLLTMSFIAFSCAEDQIECVRVSGNIESQSRSVSGYNKIFFKDVGNLHISQGNEYNFTAEGQKVVLEALETTVENDELIINLNKCFNGESYQLDIYLTLPEIKGVEMAGTGQVISENIWQTDNLSLKLSGLSQSFNVQCNVDSLSIQLTGNGSMDLSGESTAQSIVFSGIGEINAYGLQNQRSYIDLNSPDNCYVNVSESIVAEFNGSGNIYYIGSPGIIVLGDGGGQIIDGN